MTGEIYKSYYIWPFDGYYDVHEASRSWGPQDGSFIVLVDGWFIGEEVDGLFSSKKAAKEAITERVKRDKEIRMLDRWVSRMERTVC